MGGRSGQKIVSGNNRAKISSLVAATAKEAEKIHKGDVAGFEDSVYFDENRNGQKTTAELKEEVGAYISTEKIYGRDNVPIPKNVRYHIQDLGREKVDALINQKANKTIKIEDINIAQQYVFEKPLNKALSKQDYKVVVFEYKGKYYLNDGNHRVAAAKINNIRSIKVVVKKVDE